MMQTSSTKGFDRAPWTLRLMVVAGLVASVYYFSWWSDGGRVLSPMLALALVIAAVYHWTQLFSSWLIYLSARAPRELPRLEAGERPTVDVFLTACGEDPALVETALRAVIDMRGEHRSLLLDDGNDPALRALAKRLGADYLTRSGRTDAKAGNVNAALPQTDGDVIVIFDIDHAPEKDFLERSLGHFADEKIGFVQVMLTFRNAAQSWFARAAGETCFDFFNPTSLGMDRMGAATLIGSNALIRRRALQSIGGYRPGLAEDLATSIALHAEGWKSAYVAEPLAPGLAPPDLAAWFTQQLKWARGVFEILLVDYPRYFLKLRWGQRLAYAVRMTYYWAGLVTAIHMVFTFGILLGGERVAVVDLRQYLLHLLPLTVVAFAIRQQALRLWRHPSVPGGLHWRALVLIQSTWPIYTIAWLMTILRLELGFQATPKKVAPERRWNWLMPQIVSATLLCASVAIAALRPTTPYVGLLVLFALLQTAPQMLLMWQARRPVPR